MPKHKTIEVGINFERELTRVVGFLNSGKKDSKRDAEDVRKVKDFFIILGQLSLIAFLKFAEKVVTASSRIFPFSFLLRNNRFHYSRKPMMDTWNELNEANRKSKTNFYVKNAYADQYFYNYIGEFEGDHTNKNIENYLEMLKGKFKGNVFMQDYSRGLKLIKVVREAVV